MDGVSIQARTPLSCLEIGHNILRAARCGDFPTARVMLQKKGRPRSTSLKVGKSSGPRIITNIRGATKQQIITRHNFYMYEFRTKYCQDFPLFMCKQAKPYTCVKAHYENNIRRRPRLVNGKFNFTDKLCAFASITDCPQGMNCTLSHRVQKEHIYHPSLYKTQLCESPLTEEGVCAEFGVHCAKAHGLKDLRQPQYEPDDPRVHLQRSGSSSPHCSSDSSTESKGGESGFQIPRTFDENTKELKIHADYMYKFRVKACIPHALRQCQFDGNTCFHSHGGANATRRIPELINGKFNYLPIRCQYMLKGKTCHHARNCRFAHSKEEVIYHPSKYKTQLCPHRLKKVQVMVPSDGNGSNLSPGISPNGEEKTREMWVCAGYGIHCAKAHGKDDLRLPVFENCSKEVPVKPMSSPFKKILQNHPDAMIFKPNRMVHRRYSDAGVVSNGTVYRSMNMNGTTSNSSLGSSPPLYSNFPKSTAWGEQRSSSFHASWKPALKPGSAPQTMNHTNFGTSWLSSGRSSSPSQSPQRKQAESESVFSFNSSRLDVSPKGNGFYGLSSQLRNLKLPSSSHEEHPRAEAQQKQFSYGRPNPSGNGRLGTYLPSFLVNFVTKE